MYEQFDDQTNHNSVISTIEQEISSLSDTIQIHTLDPEELAPEPILPEYDRSFSEGSLRYRRTRLWCPECSPVTQETYPVTSGSIDQTQTQVAFLSCGHFRPQKLASALACISTEHIAARWELADVLFPPVFSKRVLAVQEDIQTSSL